MFLFDPKTLKTITIENRNWQVSPVIYDSLKRADNKMFSTTGKHIKINYAYRSTELQKKIYDELRAMIPPRRAAPPGKSFHERGQAIDVTNWKEAEPFLKAEGFLNNLADDKGHFSVGEFKTLIKKESGAIGLLLVAGIIYLITKYIKGN